VEEVILQAERILRIALTVIAAYMVALWIASIWWTFRDIRARTTDIFLQIAATLLVATFSFAGLLIYVILRPPKTLAELYEESLEEEAFLQGIHVQTACPVCKQRAEPEFIFCPWCQARLKRLCGRCERPLMLRWKMCPYCGQPTQTAARAPLEEPTSAASAPPAERPTAAPSAGGPTAPPAAERPMVTTVTRRRSRRSSGETGSPDEAAARAT
jgi:RNA polymerase subunit RPABC4/transcription elongation factor Spt4